MHPTLFQLGPVPVGTHDFFSVLAVGVGLAIYYTELRRRGWLDERIVLISLAVLLGGVIGARTLTAWERLDGYATAFASGVPLSWAIEQGGKSIVGAIAGGYLAAVLAKRALGYTRSTGDCYVIALPVAIAIGRIGCFLSELPLGTPTDLPWGIAVDPAAAAAFARCPGCDVSMHPSMLYEVLFNVAAVGVILVARRHVPVPGDLLKLYLLAAAVFRLWVENVRGNEAQAFGLTGPQVVLIPLALLLIGHFARQLWRGAYHVPAAPPVPAAPRLPAATGPPTSPLEGGLSP
jgi:prolipoprotein diacylglyceryltransferase